MTSNTASYKRKIEKCIEILPPINQINYIKALSPYKFSLEIYVPKNLLNKREINDKNYLRNKLVQFDDNYEGEKSILNQIKKNTDQFSKQYKLVTNICNDRKNQFSNKNRSYQEEITEIYKMKGYSQKDIELNENIFNPSLLLEIDNNFDMVCEVENSEGIEEDKNFMQNVQGYIKQKTKKGSNLSMGSGNEILDGSSKSKSIDLSKVTLRQMKSDNKKIWRENKKISKYIRDIHPVKTEPNVNSKKRYKYLNKKKVEKIKVDGIFVSSKGMLRSAKQRIVVSGLINNTQSRNQNTKVKEMKTMPEKSKEDEVVYERKRIKSLYGLYNDILKKKMFM